MQTVNVKVQRPEFEQFRSFGQWISKPSGGSKTPTLKNDFLQFFGGLAFIEPTPMEFGICIFQKRPLVAAQLEQHRETKELLYAIDGDFYLPLVPLNSDGSPDVANAVAIHVKQGEGVVLNEKIWHWAPYTLGFHSSILVGFKEGTATNDLIIQDIEEQICIVEV